MVLLAAVIVPTTLPATEKDFRIVSTAELKAMMDGKQNFVNREVAGRAIV